MLIKSGPIKEIQKWPATFAEAQDIQIYKGWNDLERLEL